MVCSSCVRSPPVVQVLPPTTVPTPSAPPSELQTIIEVVIAQPDFRAFGARDLDTDEAVFVLLAPPVPVGPLRHPSKRVVVLSEEDCLKDMIREFFEIVEVQVEEGWATVKYAYPEGAHFGTLTLTKREGVWVVTNKDSNRSSSFRRSRLERFLARLPNPGLDDSGFRPDDRARCAVGELRACFRCAVTDHNAGRLERAEALYGRACAGDDFEACHNLGLMEFHRGKQEEGLSRLERLCSERGVKQSCAVWKKYGTLQTR